MRIVLASTFTWLDYSEHDRRQMLDAIKLLGERQTRDELGLGGVRDAFADQLFPMDLLTLLSAPLAFAFSSGSKSLSSPKSRAPISSRPHFVSPDSGPHAQLVGWDSVPTLVSKLCRCLSHRRPASRVWAVHAMRSGQSPNLRYGFHSRANWSARCRTASLSVWSEEMALSHSDCGWSWSRRK